MKLFDVYPLFDINVVKGKGCHVWDDKGQEYLDLYGGHAVISIGHAHPHYVETISKQVATLGFYSNSVINKLQQEVADRLGAICGYDDYQLFLINSGAEANENALKLASFYNGRTRVVSFNKAFHGRTSLAVEVTDNPKIIAPINANRHVTYLSLNDAEAMKRVDEYVREILATQDEDGYLGIYTPSLRYRFDKENGELWSKTTLLRGLLAYYEATGKQEVWKAICRAVDNVMEKWPIYGSAPFDAGTEYNGGVAHGLTFTDVLDRMYQLTGDRKYLDYALFLYLDYSSHFSSESDAQLENILDKEYKLKCHGVHTYEHLRPLIVAAQTTTDEKVINALNLYLERIAATTTATGGAIGDEWIGERCAHPYDTGYEFCSLHELLNSYSVLLQKKGEVAAAERMETIFYNAALGMRLKDGSGIAYLKTDNSYEMRGTRNGHPEADRKQTRYKYSPVHQDVAVCCVPNSLRITPYFIQKAWMTDSEGHLVCNLLLPCALETEHRGGKVKIEMQTGYPLSDSIRLSVYCETDQRIKLRKPVWAKEIKASKEYATEGDYLGFSCKGGCTEQIDLKLVTAPRVIQDRNGFHYFAYGAVIYALHHEAAEEKGRVSLAASFTYFILFINSRTPSKRFSFR